MKPFVFTPERLGECAIAAQAALSRLLDELTTRRGVHLESALSALGALAGRACQLAALEGVAGKDPDYVNLSLAVVTGADGSEYFFGDAINRPLVERQYSIWDLVAAKTTELGGTVPDRDELFAHNAEMVGTPDYGVPRWGEDTSAELPRTFLPLFDRYQPTVRKSAKNPQQWPVVYGVAIQKLFDRVVTSFDSKLDVGIPARVVLDSTIAMAKLKS